MIDAVRRTGGSAAQQGNQADGQIDPGEPRELSAGEPDAAIPTAEDLVAPAAADTADTAGTAGTAGTADPIDAIAAAELFGIADP